MSNIIKDDQPVTEQAYTIVLDRVKQIRASGATSAKASEIGKYYGFPASYIRKIFKLIYDRKALPGDIKWKD